MAKLALHSVTARQLEHFTAQPSHAVLLTGPMGIGKTAVADYLAAQLAGQNLETFAYLKRITSLEGKAITIEQVRELEHFLSLKVPGSAAIKRLVIIEQAQLLGTEAQNAILKTLEEPPADTVIILTATSAQSLLPTIQSRLQSIQITKPAKADLLALISADDSSYALTGGLPGLLYAMMNDETHPLLDAVKTARGLLSQTAYERLNQVDVLAKDKPLAINVLTILQQMAHISLRSASGAAAKRWQGIMIQSYQAGEQLSASAQPKLALTNLLLNL